MRFYRLLFGMTFFMASLVGAQPPGPMGPMGFPPPDHLPPDSDFELTLLYIAPADADSAITAINASVASTSAFCSLYMEVDTAGTMLSGWTVTTSGTADSIRFEATAPTGGHLQHDDPAPAMLLRLRGHIAPDAADGDSCLFFLRDVSRVAGGVTQAFPDDWFAPGVIFVGEGGPPPEMELFAITETSAMPGDPFAVDFLLTVPVPPDSELSRIRGTVKGFPPDLAWDASGHGIGAALSGWTTTVTGSGDSLTFDLVAPSGVYLSHLSLDTLHLLTLKGQVLPGAPAPSVIDVRAAWLALTGRGIEHDMFPAPVRPGAVLVGDEGPPPPPPGDEPFALTDAAVMPGDPFEMEFLLTGPMPPDSQFSRIRGTIRGASPDLEWDASGHEAGPALSGWTTTITGSADSLTFDLVAPSGVYLDHTTPDPLTIMRLKGSVLPTAPSPSDIQVHASWLALTTLGVEHQFFPGPVRPGSVHVGEGEPPGFEPFAITDTSAMPGESFAVDFELLVPVPPDSQISRLRGTIRGLPPEVEWDASGHSVDPSLAGWTASIAGSADSLTFDLAAPAGSYLTHSSFAPLPLMTLHGTVLPGALMNAAIDVVCDWLAVTMHGVELEFSPAPVIPGKIFVGDGGPPPPPPPPPPISTDGRINLGLYGGYVMDYAYDEVHDVVLAAVAAPQSVFISSDSGYTWQAAFPSDSLEFSTDGVTRGFGGRGMQVESSGGYSYSRTSQEAGTLTGAQVSEDGVNWRTLMDAYLIREIVRDRLPGAHDGPRAVTGMSARGPIALVASHNLVFRTTDAGRTWDVTVVPHADSVNSNGFVTDMSVRGKDTSGQSFFVVFRRGWDRPEGVLMRTEDATTFTPIPIVSGSDTAKAISGIVAHPTNSDTLWVSTGDMPPGMGGLWRSFDAGNSWTKLPISTGMGMGVQVELYQDAGLPGTDNIRLVAVGENSYSDDLGDSWTSFSPSDDPTVPRVSAANAGMGHIANSDIYFGQGDGAPSRSTNGIGGTYYFVPTGIEGITIWKIAQIASDPDKVYLATSVGVAYTSAFTDTSISSTSKWASPYGNYPINPVGGGNTGFTAIAIDPDNTSHIVAANGNAIFTSTTGGFTNDAWTSVPYDAVTGLDVGVFKGQGGRVSAIAFLNSDSIFAAAYCENTLYGRLLLSDDGGNSWQALPQAGDHNFKSIIVASTGAPGSEVLYASGGGVMNGPGGMATQIDTGAVYKSLDRGATWLWSSYGPDAVFNPLPYPLPVNDMAAVPGSVDTLYMACGWNLSNAIARSYDGGSTLETISMAAVGMYEGAFEAVAINKHYPDSVYFAVRRDILVYDASVNHTSTLFRGYPGELTHDLLYDGLTMGSSAGFYEIESPTPGPTGVAPRRAGQPGAFQLRQNYPNPFNPATRISFTLERAGHLKLEVFNTLGQRVAVLLDGRQEAGQHTVTWQPTALSSGVYFYRLQATAATGRKVTITRRLMFVR